METQYSKSNIHSELPNDIFLEVLARLPVKSILRFKSVSKNWFHLFTSDMTFRQLYKARAYAREGGVIHVIPPEKLSYYRDRPEKWDPRIFVIDMKKPPNARAKVYEPSLLPFDVDTRSNIIDGLICFYNRHHNGGSIYVYNIFTREVFHLPRPKETYIVRGCLIGYDPNNMEYKVVRLCIIKDSISCAECEVFTLDNNDKPCRNEYRSGWRTIDISYMESDYFTSPHDRWWSAYEDGFCHNGVIYCTSEFNFRTKKKGILMFDVEREKFEAINCPREIIGSLAYIQGYLSCVNVKTIDDNASNQCLEITWWKIVDLEDKNKLLFTNTVLRWPLPSFLRKYPSIRYNHLGHVFILRWQLSNNQYIIDCYDISTRKYKELQVNNAQGMLGHFYYFEPYLVVENIVPLKRMAIKD